MSVRDKTSIIFSYPFRIFFLLAATYAALLIPGWLFALWSGFPGLTGISLYSWHVHEVIFGLVCASIAGFLLTAICTWTGCKPLQGWTLAGLALLWLCGRVVMWLPAYVPHFLVRMVDLAFLAVLVFYSATVILSARNYRNLVIVLLLVFLLIANSLMQTQLFQEPLLFLYNSHTLSINLIIVLMCLIAGRITPAFSRNWLRLQQQKADRIRTWPLLDNLALISTALIIPVELLRVSSATLGSLVLLASALNLLRLWNWHGWLCRQEPLLWILHLGYGWIIIALLLKGLSLLTPLVSPVAWIHAAGVGAMGSLIIGVMTRVSLGHTGRPLTLPRWSVASYWLVSASALVRLLQAQCFPASSHLLLCSALLWSLAFLVFLWRYLPILTSPDQPKPSIIPARKNPGS